MSESLDPPAAAASPIRVHLLRVYAGVLTVLLLAIGATAAFRLYESAHHAQVRQASDGATILAFAGIRDFVDRADPVALMRIPVGADSMFMKVRVFVGESSTATYAVRVVHLEPAAFRLRSTGRLVAEGRAMVCSLDVFVRFDRDVATRPAMGVAQQPLCNGSRHSSAVTGVRNIGS